MNNRRAIGRTWGLIALALVTLWPAVGRSDLIVSFGPSVPTPLVPGGTGYVDVFVRSDNNDHFSGYQLDFALSTPDGLTFADTQDNSYVNNSNYVFFNNPHLTLAADQPSSAVTDAVFSDGLLNASLEASEFITLDNTDLLLGRLQLNVAAGTTPGKFDLGSLASIGFFAWDNPTSLIDYTVDADRAGIINVSAVPEPSTLGLAAVALASTGLFWRRRTSVRQPQELR